MIIIKKIILVFLVISLSACTWGIEEDKKVVLQTLSSEDVTLTSEDGFIMEEVVESNLLAKQVSVVKAATSSRTGIPWLISKISEGSPKMQSTTYRITYDGLGNVLSKVTVPGSTVTKESVPTIWMYGAKVATGAYFHAKFSRYGADCGGCRPYPDGTAMGASGIVLTTTAVRQSNGAWKTGITYDGYYVLASSPSLPMCTILEIKNHVYSGMGLVPGKPFRAMILDRGVSGTTLDLFVGSEKHLNAVRLVGKHAPVATIVGFAKWTRNSLGQRVCK